MYKRSIKRYAWGDYYNQEGALQGNRITNVASFGNLAGGAIDVIDPGNKYGVRSTAGAGLSGLAKGAAAGAALGPVGAIVGGVLGGVTGLFKNEKAKEAEEEAKRIERESKMSAIINHSKGVLSTYPSEGVIETLTARYGMKIPKFPAGGNLPYPTDGSEVEQLSSDSAVYNGNTHANGGIDLDTNQDGQPEIEVEDAEVIKDDMVLSNRLSPTEQFKESLKAIKINVKNNDTYASLAEKLAKKKGKFEEKLDSTRIGEANTAKLMTQRYDMILNSLFEDQQMNKSINNIGNYAYGGIYPDPPSKNKGTSFYTKTRKGVSERNYDTDLTKNRGILEKKGGISMYDISKSDFDQFNNEGTGILTDVDVMVRNEAINRFKANKNLFSTVIGEIPPMGSETTQEQIKTREKYGLMNNNQSGVFSGADIYMEEPILPKDNKGGKRVIERTVPSKPSTVNTFPGVYFKHGGQLGDKKGYYIGNDWVPLKRFGYGDGIPFWDWRFDNAPEIPDGNMAGGMSSPTGGAQPDPNELNVREDGFAGVTSNRVPFMEKLEGNIGNLAAGVGYFANQAQIGKLETNYKPTLSKAPNYNFRSRLPYISNEVRSAYRDASNGIKGSSSQDNQALRANLFAKTLNTLNQATSDEFAREDSYKRDYNQAIFRNNLANTQILNQANYASMDNRNQRRALTQQNMDALLRSVQGNIATKQARDLDLFKTKLELYKSGVRGIDDRFLKQLTPRERRLYLNG